MLKLLLVLGAGATALLLLDAERRDWVVDRLKDASDAAVAFVLRSTSEFGSELTEDGSAEQRLWREQRLRDLRYLGRVGRG